MDIKTIKSALKYYTVKNKMKQLWYKIKSSEYVELMPYVYDELETLRIITENNLSVSRIGDGELAICLGRSIYFQKFDNVLSERLKQIIMDESSQNMMVCLSPHTNSSFKMTDRVQTFVYKYFSEYGKEYVGLLRSNKRYGSTFISRPDSFLFKNGQLVLYRNLLRKIWQGRDVLVVTGEGSRFELIPELFDNVKSSSYLYGLPENAFNQYDELLHNIKLQPKTILILLALGPTATVMAFDLALEGFQAIDLGHLPSSYMVATSNNRPYKLSY